MTERKVTIGRLLALLRGPEWLSRDAHIVILARAVRTFGYGCTSILLAGMLSEDGVPAAGIGLLLGVAALGSVTASIAMGVFADRFGRRRSLLVTAGLMGLAGVVFAVCESYPVLLVAAFIGTISPSTNDNSPFSGVEQAMLAQTCPAQHHTALFARYSMSALLAGALGGLGAAALGLLTVAEPGDAAFLLYAVLSILIFGLYRRLSPDAEPAAGEPNDQAPVPHPVREGRRPSPLMCKLACLFAVDAFAGGLAVQAILALWFQQRFGATDAQLGILFFGANLLPALSQAIAPALVVRYGLLGTMLIPHALSNLLLLCVPWSPTFGWAATALWTRQALSKIDVPARQAFTAAVVTPAERTAAASLTTVARSIAVSASPLTSSLMLAGPMIACGAPFLLGGGLALAYDVTMWHSFRDVAAAAVARGRHRLRRTGVQAPPPIHAPADTDDPPTIATPSVALDDTIPLEPRYDPVEHVRARRRMAPDMDAPRGFVHWEEVHGYLQRPNQPGTRFDPLPSAAPHPTNAPRRTQ
jgi:predicted MFS family arabinose efflux permease